MAGILNSFEKDVVFWGSFFEEIRQKQN